MHACGQFRLHLRSVGLDHATSADADAIFDSWDDDRGGTLDLKELKEALIKLTKEARAYREKPDLNQMKVNLLRARAVQADEAAHAAAEANGREAELQVQAVIHMKPLHPPPPFASPADDNDNYWNACFKLLIDAWTSWWCDLRVWAGTR